MPLAFAVIIAMLLALACGSSGDATDQPRSPRATAERESAEPAAYRIVFLGDSLTAGFGVAEQDAFPARIERALRDEGYDVRVLNAGVSGDTSAGGLSRLNWTLRGQPQLVVIELGGNDALRGQPLENTELNLREIAERIKRTGADVLLLGMDVPSNFGHDYSEAFAGLYSRIAEALDVSLVPGFVREVGSNRSLMQLDGLHPTAEGHVRLAELLLPYVRERITVALAD